MISEKLAKYIYHYFIFFLLVAFLVTCSTTLFTTTLTKTLDIVLTKENLHIAARLTFMNVIFISLLLTIIDMIRRKLTVERSTKHIIESAKKIVNGDFSVRVKHLSKLGADDHFNEIIDCFNQMAQELSSVETLRSDFISNVSHELKTPLSIMQNYAVLLQSEHLTNEKRIEYATVISNSAKRLSDMTTNILKLNRLENQKIYPKIEYYNLGEQLAECLLVYESMWEKKNIHINIDIEENVMIHSDKELLSLVWSNLFSNAFKFTPCEGSVWISLATDQQFATIKVSDSGCGISPEVGSHIFEKFYQGDTSHATQGNGLGLALVKRVIDIVHGEIHVESAVGKGTCFTIKIRRV